MLDMTSVAISPPRSDGLSENDLALVEALQRAPRAPWTRIGAAVGVDATTAARRWDRLSSAGLAWLTAYPTAPMLTIGYLHLACRPDTLAAVTRQLCQWPSVFSVERTSGRHQLFVGACARDLVAMDSLVSGRLGELDGLTAAHLAVATRIYREGSGWLIGALAPAQRTVLHETHQRLPGASRWGDDELAVLIRVLNTDGRRSSADLARVCGVSETAVRRQVARMIGTHELLFRCDIAHQVAGWPVVVHFRASVPGNLLDGVGHRIAELPETRLCAAVTGEANLVVSAWLRTSSDCADFEARLAASHPAISIVDRDITINMPKRMGRLLDPRGVAIGHVPIAPA